MSGQLESWICTELNKLLGCDASEDIASYLVTVESDADVREYLADLLNPNVPRHQRFIDQLMKRWRPPERKVPAVVPDNVTVYRKTDDGPDYFTSANNHSKGAKKKEKKTLNSVDTVTNGVSNMKLEDMSSQKEKLISHPRKESLKKSPKFVPLFSEEGHAKTAAKLPGRYQCDCLATKHNLINNCTQCGRIVCEQEGSGPCLFCGQLVCTKEEQTILASGSKRSERLRQQLMDKHSKSSSSNHSLPAVAARMKEGLEKAVQHKEKLLDYDRTSVKRTQVIDDESDYFSTESRWLSKKEKEKLSKREEELRAKKYASHKDRKVTLDFAGRRVVDAEDSVHVYDVNDSVVQEIHYGKSSKEGSGGPHFREGDFTDLVNPAITQAPPVFVESKKWSKVASQSNNTTSSTQKTSRIQDREILEMSDEGMCLSMHQPWALLLVQGIKIHEGRSWYTPHRGRLWIAATSKTPAPEEIAQVEHQHRCHFKDDDIEFPKDYPAGCLLGCVDVVDCLGQEEYREKYPDGDSGSPYVFICENPQELVLKFPMKGKHKIYKLDHHIHQAAKKGLKKS